MTLPPGLRIQIEERLAALLKSSDAEGAMAREEAARHRALPLYGDMGGYILLRPDGELIGLPAGGDTVPGPEAMTQEKWRTVALLTGAEKYPELRALLPSRPSQATDCGSCSGTGRFRKTGAFCGACGGLGWNAG